MITISSSSFCGHEFIGEVVALGANFHSGATGRPYLYSTLRVGDKVVSPFTVSCGECQYVITFLFPLGQSSMIVFISYCRVGFTSRCVESKLFGTPHTPGGQAQYVRVPCAGGTLYNLEGILAASVNPTKDTIGKLADSSLLLLSDILPTGVFAAFQALNHPKMLPILTSRAYPDSSGADSLEGGLSTPLTAEDKVLTIAIVGLGPVGVVCRGSLAEPDAVANTTMNTNSVRVSRCSTCSIRETSSFALSQLTPQRFDERK